MSVHLKADIAALKASNQRLADAIGDKRFRAAQDALAAESGTRPKLAIAPPAAAAPADDATSGLSTRERADLAFLRSAGVIPQEAADVSAADDASDILALVRAAGLPGYKQAGAK